MSERAVILDVGGVLLVPDAELIATYLQRVGIDVDIDPISCHYHAIHGVDNEPSEHFNAAYGRTYLGHAGVLTDALTVAMEALEEVWRLPSSTSWSFLLPNARRQLRDLTATRRVAIVSNSDGTVEASLRDQGLCQVGTGEHASVATVVDSGVIGITKPDARIFTPALKALRVEPNNAIYVGDSERIDVLGARNAGIEPLHLDPLALCERRNDHAHLASLDELLASR